MKRIFPILIIFLLAACAAPTTPTPVISTQEKSSPTPAPTATATPTETPEPTPTPTPAIDVQSAFHVDKDYAKQLESEGIADSVEVGKNGEMTLKTVIVGFDEKGEAIIKENFKVKSGSQLFHDYNHGDDIGRLLTFDDEEGKRIFWSAEYKVWVYTLDMSGTKQNPVNVPEEGGAKLISQSIYANNDISKEPPPIEEQGEFFGQSRIYTMVNLENGTGFDYIKDGQKIHLDKGSVIQILAPRDTNTFQYLTYKDEDGEQHLSFFKFVGSDETFPYPFVPVRAYTKDEKGDVKVAFPIVSEGEWWDNNIESNRISDLELYADNLEVPGIIIAQQGGYRENNVHGGVFVAQPSLDRLVEEGWEEIKDLMMYWSGDGKFYSDTVDENMKDSLTASMDHLDSPNGWGLDVYYFDLEILNHPYGLFSIASSTIK